MFKRYPYNYTIFNKIELNWINIEPARCVAAHYTPWSWMKMIYTGWPGLLFNLKAVNHFIFTFYKNDLKLRYLFTNYY